MNFSFRIQVVVVARSIYKLRKMKKKMYNFSLSENRGTFNIILIHLSTESDHVLRLFITHIFRQAPAMKRIKETLKMGKTCIIFNIGRVRCISATIYCRLIELCLIIVCLSFPLNASVYIHLALFTALECF